MLRKYAALDVIDVYKGGKTKTMRREAARAVFNYEAREGYIYVRSRAISSRCNDNFDFFGSEDIKKGYKTFIGKPVFVNHHNDDHRRARGVIIDAALHEHTLPNGDPDTWVEVLMEIDAITFPELSKAILNGDVARTSMGCFLPGTPITMSDGTKKDIDKIVVGDDVLTHMGNIEDVTYVMERDYDGLVYDIRSYGQADPFILTPEHPVWIRRGAATSYKARTTGESRSTSCVCGRSFESSRSLSAHLREAKRRSWSDLHRADLSELDGWVEAKDVRVGDWVLTPHHSEASESVGVPLATLLGYYLAEGNLCWDKKNYGDTPTGVEWNFHVNEKEYVEEIALSARAIGYAPVGPYVKNNCVTIRVNSRELADRMVSLGGKHSWSKTLDSSVFNWKLDELDVLIRSYLNGDGCYRDNRVEAGTASKNLAEQLYLVASKVGLRMTPPIKQHSPSTQKMGHRPKYVMQSSLSKRDTAYVNVDKFGTWRRVTETRGFQYTGKVYNFDVEGDDSYVASDVAAHNCDVQESECSICGNVATTPLEYCPHIPGMKGKVFYKHTASGKRRGTLCYEICRGLSFFENSLLVEPPADPTAYFTGVDTRGLKSMASKGKTVDMEREVSDPDRFDGVSLKEDDSGYYVHTHRARSDSYDHPDKIPNSVIDKIESTGSLRGVTNMSRKHALGETKAPPEVDTLRDETCPVCNEEKLYSGDRCPVCGFSVPPSQFLDPDLTIHRNLDLRGDGESGGLADPDHLDQEGDFQGPENEEGLEDSLTDPESLDEESEEPILEEEGLPEGEEELPLEEEVVEDEVPLEDADGMLICPNCEFQIESALPQTESSEPAGPASGDPCPNCEEAPLMSMGEIESMAEEEVMQEEGIPVEEEEQGIKGQSALTNNRKVSSMNYDEVLRRLAVVELQNEWLAKTAGVEAEFNGIKTEAERIIRQADILNPASPVPDPNTVEPSESTEEALAPDTADDPRNLGLAPGSTEDVPADQSDLVLRPGMSLPTSPVGPNGLQDVTAPVVDTEQQLPLEQTRIETDVRVGDPDNPEKAFPWTIESNDNGSSERSIASIRLAELRVKANLAQGDKYDLASKIQTDASLSNQMINNEIKTLSQVLQSTARTASSRGRVPKLSDERQSPSLSFAASNHVEDDGDTTDLFLS